MKRIDERTNDPSKNLDILSSGKFKLLGEEVTLYSVRGRKICNAFRRDQREERNKLLELAHRIADMANDAAVNKLLDGRKTCN